MIETRREIIRRLFVAFPMGATEDRCELYERATAEADLHDLAQATSRLIEYHRSTRAPTVAELLSGIRDAKTVRLTREIPQIGDGFNRPLADNEKASVRKMYALGRAGIFWCCRTGSFIRGPSHRTAEQCERDGFSIRDPSLSDIDAAHRQHLEEVPF